MHLTLVSLYPHLPRSADLALGMVTEATLMELFNGSLGEIFKSPTGQPPCVQVSMAGAINCGFRHRGTHDGTYSSAVLRSSCATGDGKFAFVEFATPEMASAGLSLNGLMLHGRPLRVGRPQVRCICTPVVFIGSHLVPRRVECIQLGHRCDLIAGICAAS
jgi:hypothetical protein